MDVSLSSWLVIAVALAGANLPFLKRELALWKRLLLLLVLYFAVGALAYALESRIGTVFGQAKEFYMITVPLFVVLAFPGFVYRYLRKHR
ncbi:MAG: DUF2818 family protein [Pseudomonadota bacterium]